MAPLSEVFGRTPIYITSMFLYFIFTLPSALAKNSATLVIGRLLAGISASAPMCNVGGRWVSVFIRYIKISTSTLVSQMFGQLKTEVPPWPCSLLLSCKYAIPRFISFVQRSSSIGPCLGPMIGGWIGMRAGWRWNCE